MKSQSLFSKGSVVTLLFDDIEPKLQTQTRWAQKPGIFEWKGNRIGFEAFLVIFREAAEMKYRASVVTNIIPRFLITRMVEYTAAQCFDLLRALYYYPNQDVEMYISVSEYREHSASTAHVLGSVRTNIIVVFSTNKARSQSRSRKFVSVPFPTSAMSVQRCCRSFP